MTRVCRTLVTARRPHTVGPQTSLARQPTPCAHCHPAFALGSTPPFTPAVPGDHVESGDRVWRAGALCCRTRSRCVACGPALLDTPGSVPCLLGSDPLVVWGPRPVPEGLSSAPVAGRVSRRPRSHLSVTVGSGTRCRLSLGLRGMWGTSASGQVGGSQTTRLNWGPGSAQQGADTEGGGSCPSWLNTHLASNSAGGSPATPVALVLGRARVGDSAPLKPAVLSLSKPCTLSSHRRPHRW